MTIQDPPKHEENRGFHATLEPDHPYTFVDTCVQIWPDADLDTAVACAVDGAFSSTGQRCTASSRLIVTEGIHEPFGGTKGSSYGPKEQGIYAREFFTDVKASYVKAT